MGLLDYYRQFDDVDQEEYNKGLRERRAREKAQALERVEVLDLSGTEWPDMPNSEVANAAIYAVRGNINGYPDRFATPLRAAIASRHGVAPEQVVVGNGAAELLQSSAHVLLGGGAELVTPWPSYPLYPLMAQRAGGGRSRSSRPVSRRCSRRSRIARAPSCCATRTTRPGPTCRRMTSRHWRRSCRHT